MKKIILLLASLFSTPVALAESAISISPQQAAQMQTEKNAVIIDVRETDEWNSGHIAGAIHVPLGQIQTRLNELTRYQNSPVIMQCRSGGRSTKAATLLTEAGFKAVYNMDGGLNAWQKANLQTIKTN